MSLNKFRAVSLKDKLDAQEAAIKQELVADVVELEAVVKAKKRASKN